MAKRRNGETEKIKGTAALRGFGILLSPFTHLPLSPSAHTSWLDPAGIGLSLLCALHCLLAPLFITLLPLTGLGILADERTEVLLVFAALAVATASLAWGFRIHRQQRVLLTLGAATAMMLLGRFARVDGPYEIALVTTGAALLVVSHALNFHLCRRCAICGKEEMTVSRDTILKTAALALGYGEHVVLRDVNFHIQTGEFWFFLGQNGGGKSTLLRAVLGLLPPLSGTLWLHPDLGSRERTGFVPQRCDLNHTLPITVREFVQLGLVGLQVNKAERSHRLTWALEKMGLLGLEGHSYWSLSGGQRQRALVARALIRRPALLVLDEPTNNLDLPTEDALLRLLAALNQSEQQTILFVTHNVELATRYASHVGLLYSGQLLAGPRETVLTPGNLARIYGGETLLTSDSSAHMVSPTVLGDAP
jgi:ABC-type Mn2+/Zn2+ transport system ATPase subunit